MTPREREDSSPVTAVDPGKPAPHTSDHLANERTFLAWIRTSISVIGLGFVVAKFGVWLRQLAVRLDEPTHAARAGFSLPLGVGMMSLGGVVAVVAAWRYRGVRRAIDRGEPAADERTMVSVTLMVVAITVALVAYMLVTT